MRANDYKSDIFPAQIHPGGPLLAFIMISNDQLTGRQPIAFKIHPDHLTTGGGGANNDSSLSKSFPKNQPEQPDCRRMWFEAFCEIGGRPSAGAVPDGAAGD